MDLTQFLADTTKNPITLAILTTIAADKRAHGDDIIAAFRSQIEQRSTSAQTVLDAAQAAGRDSLLASEQRSYDTAIRERDAILGLQRAVEQRTATVAFVPPTQVLNPETRTEDMGPVLSRESKVSTWLQRRGGYAYQGERGAETARLGAVIRALALGDRRGLSPLEARALAEGTGSSGGYTVPEVLGAGFIDRVRSAMVVMRAGAQTVPMTSDVLHLARLAQPGSISPAITTAAWKSENSDITETDLTLERMTLTAHTLPVLIKLSIELSEDSTNIDQIIERELSAQLALELDRAALLGSGTPPEPKGIVNQDGVDVDATAGTLDYDTLIDMAAIVSAQNHTPNARLYNSVGAASLAKLRAIPTGEYLQAPAYLDPITEYVTNQIENSGGSPDSTTVFVGDFSQLMIGMRTSFQLEVSRQAGTSFEKLQIWVRAYLRADVQLAHPEAFAVRTGLGF